jgi:integrase
MATSDFTSTRGQLSCLNPTQVKTAKPGDKDYRLPDGGGLFLLVKSRGSKLWRMKYYVNGKQSYASFGKYPDITLKRAREMRLQVTDLASKGIDYNQHKKAAREAEKAAVNETFKAVAEEWIKRVGGKWTPRHAGVVRRSLEKDVYPRLGSKHVTKITSRMILDTAARIADERGAHDVARRVLRRISAVMEYAAFNGVGGLEVNPAIGASKVLPENKRDRKHHPAIKWEDLPDFIKALEKADLHVQTQLALKLLMLTFVRPGELRFARRDEFDIENRIWTIPDERMKTDNDHVVPLSDQAIKVLTLLKPLAFGSDLLLPGRSTLVKPISENTLLYAIYRAGYKDYMTAHGFRAVASSWLNSEGMYQLNGKPHPFNPDAIERQLAHGEPSKVRDAYNRADYMGEREVMMQVWADFTDRCADASGKVVPMERKSR